MMRCSVCAGPGGYQGPCSHVTSGKSEPAPGEGPRSSCLRLSDGWKFLSGTYYDGADSFSEITAARNWDGIGVVASWQRTDGVWRLVSWGCTEDHGPEDDADNADPLPSAPPIDADATRAAGLQHAEANS